MGIPNRRTTGRSGLHFPLRSLSSRPHIAYLRKSTEGIDRQSKSHEQQLEEIVKQAGDIPEDLIWRDSKSGTDFESRADFLAMYEFCARHPQPKKSAGCIWMYDESRFGRPLDEDQEVDADSWFEWELKFKKLGWVLRFVETPHTGNAVADDMVTTMKAHMSSQYSRDLSRKVRRGRNNWLKQGFWVGKPPWPAVRYDRARDRILAGVERDETGELVRSAEPSVNGCELRGFPTWVEHWNWAAQQVISGRTIDEVAHHLNRQGIQTTQGHRWHRKALLEVLTNRTLIGEITYRDDDKVLHTVKARWEPIVSTELFHALKRRLTAMRKSNRRARGSGNPYILDNIHCAYCGAKYLGTPVCDKTGKPRVGDDGQPLRAYKHPSLRASNLGTHAVYERAAAHGCKQWSVSAAVAEGIARDLMHNLRGSPDWAAEVAEMFKSQQDYKSSARFELRQAETQLEELNEQLGNLLDTAKLLKRGSAGQQKVATEIEALSDKIVTAEAAVSVAQEQATNANVAFGYVKEIIDETRQMTESWETSADPLGKRRIVERWVSSIWVVVDQEPGKRFAESRALHFFLRSSPNDPRVFQIPSHGKWATEQKVVDSLALAREAGVLGGKEDLASLV